MIPSMPGHMFLGEVLLTTVLLRGALCACRGSCVPACVRAWLRANVSANVRACVRAGVRVSVHVPPDPSESTRVLRLLP